MNLSSRFSGISRPCATCSRLFRARTPGTRSSFDTCISGLGLDPALVPASPGDPGLPGEASPKRPGQLTGKVREVIFDCFGDFIGFILESCFEHHHISSREKGIADVVLPACREGWSRICRVVGAGERSALCEYGLCRSRWKCRNASRTAAEYTGDPSDYYGGSAVGWGEEAGHCGP